MFLYLNFYFIIATAHLDVFNVCQTADGNQHVDLKSGILFKYVTYV